MPFEDLIYPSALHDATRPQGILFHSVEEAQTHQYVSHPKFLFLTQGDHAQLQRAFSKKIPIIWQVHSLQSAFDALKLKGIHSVYVSISSKPILDAGWMNAARVKGMGVVFSVRDIQRAISQKDTAALLEFQKLARLLHKSRVPARIASFALEPHERITAPEEQALFSHFLGTKKRLSPVIKSST
ncbi:MAG: hypothetical protein Q8P05_02605 [Candidatus Diapherotrites archaeon]|nr:hypothetical protein [Candidatus Diapherotrites archaeon]MDZ4256223.1 hypothetical protein [archaeon]